MNDLKLRAKKENVSEFNKLMKNTKIKTFLSIFILSSILVMTTSATAAPIFFLQVSQVSVESNKSGIDCFLQPCLVNSSLQPTIGDDKEKIISQDERVITEVRSEIVEDDSCECADVVIKSGSFPKYAFWAVPFGVLLFGTIKATTNTPNNISPTPIVLPPNPVVISPMRPYGE